MNLKKLFTFIARYRLLQSYLQVSKSKTICKTPMHYLNSHIHIAHRFDRFVICVTESMFPIRKIYVIRQG